MTRGFARVILNAVAALALIATARAEPMPTDLARKLDGIFATSQAPAMVAVIIDGERTYVMGAAREGTLPNGRTLLRINSLTKTMTGEILANLIAEGRVRLDEPLSAYAPIGRRVPRAKGGRAITLRDLAAHLSALPRDLPPGLGTAGRWSWLTTVQLARPPGRVAQYSNAAYMFLGDALSAAAGKSFDTLLAHYVTAPLALADTTLSPTAEQCSRLMPTGRSDFPCASNAAIGAMGGAYSTADDMARWMRAQLSPAPGSPRALAQKPLVERAALRRVINLDMAGKADAIAMGWLRMRLGGLPVIQKTGGGGGFMNYVLLAPTANKALFITVARVDIEMLRKLTGQANDLMAGIAAESQ
ncbi:MAG: D-alanyl-D-alanine-carboxypeptidase/endopeptidase AmpH [Alphaproteobacteria bacterium]|nr:D-alanyl-D-alanine-carboxypeptidase/endopeptidase AmpH [Alphaproteobacteria bacterium]